MAVNQSSVQVLAVRVSLKKRFFQVSTQTVLGFSLVLGSYRGAIAEGIFPPLQQWNFDPNQQTLNITTHSLAQPKYFILREPNRVVIDVLDTSWDEGTVRQSYGGNVSQVRVAQLSEGITRFVLDWSGQTPPTDQQIQLRSLPQADGSVLWQLALGAGNGNFFPNNPPTQMSNLTGGVVFDTTFPPALLPPPVASSVTVPPPPIPSNLRK
jgi:hypothetical protein